MKNFIQKYRVLALPFFCLIFIILGLLVKKQQADGLGTFFFILAFIIGGHQQAIEGLTTLFTEHDLDVDLLMVVAAIGAGWIGYWEDGALLIFIFCLSGALETLTEEKNRQDIEKITQLRPETATKITAQGLEEVAVQALAIGDVLRVLPGEKIPADGLVVKGASTINQSMITGESVPFEAQQNAEVFAGTLNLTGPLEISVTKTSEKTMVSQIIQMVHEAESEVPPNQRFIEKFEKIYARFVILAAVCVIVFPPLFLDWTFKDAIYRGMVFLVVASPCAVVASITPAILAAISRGTRSGILFKGGVHVENAGTIQAVAFDKTGTLTTGKMQVTDLYTFSACSEQKLLQIAASIENNSEHPIAESILQHAAQQNIQLEPVTQVQALHGVGIEGRLAGTPYRIGKTATLPEKWQQPAISSQILALESQGKTVIFVASETQLLGLVALADTLRLDAAKTIQLLKEKQIMPILLTGDNPRTAEALAKEVGIDLSYANLLPNEKAQKISDLKAQYGRIAMIGDGINDAPALAAADVGIAMGVEGTDVALETCDVVLLSEELQKIPQIFQIGKKANRIIKQNIIFALSVILLLVISNFGLKIPLPIGVIGHEGSTLCVILNGMRMLKK